MEDDHGKESTRGTGWKQMGRRGEKNERLTSVNPTQGDAIDTAIDIAKNQRSEVVIHRRDGTIRDKDSYGHDPSSPQRQRREM